MSENKTIRHPRILVCIVPTSREKRMRSVYRNEKVPIYYECYGHGTAPSDVLDILGIGDSARLLTMTFLPRFQVRSLIDNINGSMSLRDKGNGIGFTIPITAMQAQLLDTMVKVQDNMDPEMKAAMEKSILEKAKEGTTMNEGASYAALCVFVAKGHTDEVVQAARTAGARGGTVLHGNRRGDDEVTGNLGLPQQEEQEFVLILVQNDQKVEIMKAISAACGLGTPARGIVISVPVDEVLGITA